MKFLEKLITRVLRDYVVQYLDNFDERMLEISFLRGFVQLQNLQLSNKILDNVPVPLRLKYGRLGSLRLNLPSLRDLAAMKLELELLVSDVFLCLERRPMEEWREELIVEEFQSQKQAALDSYEEDAQFFYVEKRGEEEEMNEFVLQIIQGLKVTVQRVYIRIEDPYPFALGIVIPSVKIRSEGSPQSKAAGPQALFSKLLQVEDFSIFMERDEAEVDLDRMLGLGDLLKEGGGADFEQLREQRLRTHLHQIVACVSPQNVPSMAAGGSDKNFDGGWPGIEVKEIDSNDFILKKLVIDIRLQIVLDKVRARHNEATRHEPDIKVAILCGGVFDASSKQHLVHFQVREDQINALTQFLSVTGVYNTYRLGVLKNYYERPFIHSSAETTAYVWSYERYQRLRAEGAIDEKKKTGKKWEQDMAAVREELRDIERRYRTDIMYMLRKAVNERYYGLHKAEQVRKEGLAKLENHRRGRVGSHSQERQEEHAGFFQNLYNKITGHHEEEEVVHEVHQPLDSASLEHRRRQINFIAAFTKMYYMSRYRQHLAEIELVAQDKFDPANAIQPPKVNSTMQLSFKLPKLVFQLFTSKTDIARSKTERFEEKRSKEQLDQKLDEDRQILLHLVLEDLILNMYTESKPEHLKLFLALKNIYLKDFNTPQPSLPYIIQTVIPERVAPFDSYHYATHEQEEGKTQTELSQQLIYPDVNVCEVEFETNPKSVSEESLAANQRLKFYSFGQLYIYVNLEFARRMVDLTSRVLQVQTKNYNAMVESSPPRIQQEIRKGSFYQAMLDRMYERQKEEVKNVVDNYARGTKDPPKLDLDIYFISPKIIVHESLLSSKVVNESEGLSSIVIDLGRIEVMTQLTKKERGVDYREIMDASLLYDIIIVKFGKLKISVDFNLILDPSEKSDRHAGWRHSLYKVDLTNDVNFGLQLKTCLTPFHPKYPSQIIDVKFEQFIVTASRLVFQSLIKMVSLYEHGEFQRALNLFLAEGQKTKDTLANIYDNESSIGYETERKQGAQISNFEEVNMPESISVEMKVIPVAPQKYPPLKIEINMILTMFEVQLQDVSLPQLDTIESFSPKRLSTHTYGGQKHRQRKSHLQPARSSHSQNQRQEPMIRRTFLELGISGLKTKVFMITSEHTKVELFLQSIFISNKNSMGNFKRLIHNPFQEELSAAYAAQSKNQESVSQKYKHYYDSHVPHLCDFTQLKSRPQRESIDIGFHAFAFFSPEQELLSLNNQLSLVYTSTKQEEQFIKLDIQTLQVFFLVPELKRVMRLQVDLALDQKMINEQVREVLRPSSQGKQSVVTPTPRAEKKHDFSHTIPNRASHDPLSKKKTFNIAAKNLKEDKVGRSQKKEHRGANLASAIKNAKLNEDKEKENSEKLKKMQLIKHGVQEQRRVEKIHVSIQIAGIEVILPSNLYEVQCTVLKIGLKLETKVFICKEFKEIRALNQEKTLIEQILKREEMEANVRLNELEIYVEDQSFNDLGNSFMPSRLYLIKPFDLAVDYLSKKYHRSKLNTNAQDTILIEALKSFEIQIGLKELSTYLLLGQSFFQFMNELTLMQADVDPKARETVVQARKKQRQKIEKAASGKEIEEEPAAAAVGQEMLAEERDQSLDEILINEGLIKFSVKKPMALWKRGLEKVKALVMQRHFFQRQIKVVMKGIQFSIIDNSVTVQSQVALISLALKDLTVKMRQCGYDNMKQDMMEKWFHIDKVSQDYQSIRLYLDLAGSYYNKNVFADESFIETLPLRVFIKQETPLREVKQMVVSDQMLNINFTYGLFANIHRAMTSILRLEKENMSQDSSNNDGGLIVEVEDHDRQLYRQKQVNHCLTNSKIVGRQLPQKPVLDQDGSGSSSSFASSRREDLSSSDMESRDASFYNEITDIQFINKTGEEVRFCLSNLEMDLYAQFKSEIFNSATTKQIITLAPNKSEIVPMHILEHVLSQCRDTIYRKKKNLIKIDFVVNGYRQIRNVSVIKNGIFGYYLLQNDGMSTFQGQHSSISCMLRIQRMDQYIQVFFESGLAMMNDSRHDVNIFIIEATKPHQTQSQVTIKKEQVFSAPISWFKHQTQIYYRFESSQDVKILLYKDIRDVCDPRIVNPYSDHSKVLKVNRQDHLCADIYFLKTKTIVGQFLINFQPLMTLTNLLFSELKLYPVPTLEPLDCRTLKSNTALTLYEINPYDQVNESGSNLFKIQYQESDTHTYSNSEVSLNLSKLEQNNVVGFQEGLYVDLKLEDQRDQDVQHLIYVVFEKQQDPRPLRNTEYNDFGLRKKIYCRTKHLVFQVYFPYLAVNKTPLELNLLSTYMNKTLKPFQNIFIRPYAENMQIKIDKYKKSKSFCINTFLVSGVVKLEKEKKAKPSPQECLMDPALDPENQNIIEIGTYLGLCPHPYSKTKYIKFLPRYILKNTLDIPLVLKELNSHHQIVLTPGEEIYFNDGQDEEDQLMIRVLNLSEETKPVSPNIAIITEFRPIDINNLASRPSERHPLETANQRSTIPLRAASGEEAKEITSEVQHQQFAIEVKKEFGMKNSRDIWSYNFGLSKIDDFQITVPNLNPGGPGTGWQKGEKKLFLRVNISPGPDNEATFFITFAKPYYPEYVFYNQTPFDVRVRHQSSTKLQNDIYQLRSKSREPIVLNPNMKDEDFLNIEIVDPQTGLTQTRFKYEIDSLHYLHPNEQASQFKVLTKLSGNLRFIHLMTQAQREEARQKKISQGKIAPEDPSDTESEVEDEEAIERAFDGLDVPNVDTESEESSYQTSEEEEYEEEVKFGDNLELERQGMNERDQRIQQIARNDREGKQLSLERQTELILVNIKGLGVSLVNADPKEIIYLSLYQLQLLVYQNFLKKAEIERTRRRVDFSILNFQLDNMTLKSFPVIFGPRKAFNFIERNYKSQAVSIMRDGTPISKNYVEPRLLLHQEDEDKKKEIDFFQIYLDHQVTMEGKISSQRIKRLDIALQEININFHQHSLNNILQFVTSLVELVSDDLLNDFLKSDTLFNYERMMCIMNLEDETFSPLAGRPVWEESPDQQLLMESQVTYPLAMELERINQLKKSIKRLQGVIGERPPTDEQPHEVNGLIRIEESQDAMRNKVEHQNLNAMGVLRRPQKVKTKEDVCPILSSDRVEFNESEEYNTSKILVQEISIKALRIYLTFRIQQIESAIGVMGIGQAMLNFLANFTNVSDASIYFTELDIVNAYTTISNITMLIQKHYISQGIQQVYKILGATDIVGNPAGLINNLGRGVEELYSEPFQGVLSGDISRASRGLGKGIIGFTKKTAYSFSNSISKLTGTWYLGIKGFSGQGVSEANLDTPYDIPHGAWQATKGLGTEIVKGVTGLVTVPRDRVRESGLGCMPVSKGAFQGLFGLVSTPATGVLRFINSFSTGIQNQTGGEKPIKRFRYPRYFDEREVMKDYNRVFGHAYTALHNLQGGLYKNEVILCAYDVSGYADKSRERFKDKVIVVTDKRLLLVTNFRNPRVHVSLRDILRLQLGDPDVSLLIVLTKDGKEYLIQGARTKRNATFAAEFNKFLTSYQHSLAVLPSPGQLVNPGRQIQEAAGGPTATFTRTQNFSMLVAPPRDSSLILPGAQNQQQQVPPMPSQLLRPNQI